MEASAWRQSALTAVAQIRSRASASVVYRSRMKPWNSESVVFMSTRSVSPDVTQADDVSAVTTAVRTP